MFFFPKWSLVIYSVRSLWGVLPKVTQVIYSFRPLWGEGVGSLGGELWLAASPGGHASGHLTTQPITALPQVAIYSLVRIMKSIKLSSCIYSWEWTHLLYTLVQPSHGTVSGWNWFQLSVHKVNVRTPHVTKCLLLSKLYNEYFSIWFSFSSLD